jgi:hypothetical protein
VVFVCGEALQLNKSIAVHLERKHADKLTQIRLVDRAVAGHYTKRAEYCPARDENRMRSDARRVAAQHHRISGVVVVDLVSIR